jgi:hypothetical protein
MFVFKFNDGRYLKDTGSDYITNKRHVDGWLAAARYSDYFKRYAPGGDIYEEYVTTDLNQAKVFKSKQAVRSSNAYSWGGTIHEVKLTISIEE